MTDSRVNGLFVDTIPPVVTVNALQTSSSTPLLTGTAFDANALVSLVVRVDGTDYNPILVGSNWTVQTTVPLADGVYNITVEARDGVNNVGVDATNNELFVDSTPPTVTVDSLQTTNSTPLLTGTAFDANGLTALVVRVGGVDHTPVMAGSNWSIQIVAPLADGLYDVTVEARDAANNIGVDSTTDDLRVDTTQPISQVVLPISGALLNDSIINLAWSVEDGVGSGPLEVYVFFSKDGQPPQQVPGSPFPPTTTSTLFSVVAENADYAFHSISVDLLGNLEPFQGIDTFVRVRMVGPAAADKFWLFLD
jgi:hypothetical protein